MDTTNIPQPVLIMIRGLPGSGKSYVAIALRKALGEDNVVILDPDGIDFTSAAYADLSQKLSTEGVEEKFYPNRFLKQQGYNALDAGKSIIWNQAFTDLHGFARSHGSLQEYAAEHNIPLPLLVVEVGIDPEIAKARVAERVAKGGHNVDDDAFTRFISTYRSFAGEGYQVVTVNGSNDVAISVAAIVSALRKLQQ